MKHKKIFLVLCFFVTMLTGCGDSIEREEISEARMVAQDFLTTEGYECPEGYKIKYLDENKENLEIKSGSIRIVFCVEPPYEVQEIKCDSFEDKNISKTEIQEFRNMANEFLDTEGYEIPSGYNISYINGKESVAVENNSIKLIFNCKTLALEEVQYVEITSEIGTLKIIIIIWIVLAILCIIF